MPYHLLLTKSDLDMIRHCFDIRPFVKQAAFLLTDIIKAQIPFRMEVHTLKKLREEDYRYQTGDKLCFLSVALLDTLKMAHEAGKSIIYIHSHPDSEGTCPGCVGADEEMLFRIAYGYIPFGIHASICFCNNRLAGRIWLPQRVTIPLKIVIS